MGIGWRFRTWKTEDDLPNRDESSVGFVPESAIRSEERLEKCLPECPEKHWS
jgi:hypothetical protein